MLQLLQCTVFNPENALSACLDFVREISLKTSVGCVSIVFGYRPSDFIGLGLKILVFQFELTNTFGISTIL